MNLTTDTNLDAPERAALDDLQARQLTHCMECGQPLMFWIQESNRAIRNDAGKIIALESYDKTCIHCVNPDCVLEYKTTDPREYHEHMAKFL